MRCLLPPCEAKRPGCDCTMPARLSRINRRARPAESPEATKAPKQRLFSVFSAVFTPLNFAKLQFSEIAYAGIIAQLGLPRQGETAEFAGPRPVYWAGIGVGRMARLHEKPDTATAGLPMVHRPACLCRKIPLWLFASLFCFAALTADSALNQSKAANCLIGPPP